MIWHQNYSQLTLITLLPWMPRGSWLIERTPLCWRSAFEAEFMFARSAETSKGAANIAHSPIWTLSSSRLKPKSPTTSCQPENIKASTEYISRWCAWSWNWKKCLTKKFNLIWIVKVSWSGNRCKIPFVVTIPTGDTTDTLEAIIDITVDTEYIARLSNSRVVWLKFKSEIIQHIQCIVHHNLCNWNFVFFMSEEWVLYFWHANHFL